MANVNETQGSQGIQGQEGQGRREVLLDQRRQMRHDSRVNQTYRKFLRRIEENGLSAEQAEKAAVAVLCTLEQRLVGNEPAHLEAQLPMKLKELLQRCELHEKREENVPLHKIGKDEFCRRVAEHLGDSSADVETTIRAVFGALRDHISSGEVDDVVGQLPADLAELWAPAV